MANRHLPFAATRETGQAGVRELMSFGGVKTAGDDSLGILQIYSPEGFPLRGEGRQISAAGIV